MSYGCTECEENLRQIVVANSGRKRFDCLIDQTVTLCVVKRRLQIKYGSKNGGKNTRERILDLRSFALPLSSSTYFSNYQTVFVAAKPLM